jgi:hypothetical protein
LSVTIPDTVLRETARWMVDFRDYWHSEVPTQIHEHELGQGGTPDWHPDFARWLGVDYSDDRSDQRWADNPEPRVRTTRAFRKLRKKAVREFEVCYRIIILGDPIEDTMGWLNERSIRNQKTDRYGMAETMLLLVSGVDKMRSWW